MVILNKVNVLINIKLTRDNTRVIKTKQILLSSGRLHYENKFKILNLKTYITVKMINSGKIVIINTLFEIHFNITNEKDDKISPCNLKKIVSK